MLFRGRAKRQRIDAGSNGPRWFLGVALASDPDRIQASLVRVDGGGWGPRIETAAAHVESQHGGGPGGDALGRQRSSHNVIEACERVLADGPVSRERVLAIGLIDPGDWNCSPGARGYRPTVDAAPVAVATGLNVIDAWSNADLADGGLGGPIFPAAQWLVLRQQMAASAAGTWLVDWGTTIIAAWLPNGRDASATDAIYVFEIPAGTAFLAELCSRLSGEQILEDPRGQLAVQGRNIASLNEQLTPKLRPREWAPTHKVERELVDFVTTTARDESWPLADVLCTASHALVAAVIDGMVQRDARDTQTAPAADVVLSGSGRENGLALHEFSQHYRCATCCPLETLGIEGDTWEATQAAAMAYLFVEQLPASRCSLTGARRDRVVGRLTPGDPAAMMRFARALALRGAAPAPLGSFAGSVH